MNRSLLKRKLKNCLINTNVCRISGSLKVDYLSKILGVESGVIESDGVMNFINDLQVSLDDVCNSFAVVHFSLLTK